MPIGMRRRGSKFLAIAKYINIPAMINMTPLPQ
jgi:hypothetical protein